LEDPGADGRIILKWTFRKWDVGARTRSIWIDMAQDMDRRWALVNAVMNVRVSLNAENSLVSQEGLCSMQ
jgi:hypothetical protein